MKNIEQVRKHFKNIRECHNWAKQFGDQQPEKLNDVILPAVEKEYTALEQLGVSKYFSSMVFMFGGVFTGDSGKV